MGHSGPGDQFSARVAQPTLAPDGEVLIPRNARVFGHVAELRRPYSDRPAVIILALDAIDMHGIRQPLRGRIVAMEARGSSQVIRANVPLATMFGYATELRSMTQGRATYTIQFARYEEVPAGLAEEIVAKVAGRAPARAGSR